MNNDLQTMISNIPSIIFHNCEDTSSHKENVKNQFNEYSTKTFLLKFALNNLKIAFFAYD